MEEEKEAPQPIIEQVKEYIDTQVELVKLEAIEQGAKFLSGLIVDLAIAVCFIVAFLFISVALALLLSNFMHSYWAGFGTMAGVYIIIGWVLMKRKDKMRPSLANTLIKNFFK
ncbi:MAG: phage holin family protein [Bacteroidetes bacterium]|nr:phage holin family protein [Bacteroidota bacterium]